MITELTFAECLIKPGLSLKLAGQRHPAFHKAYMRYNGHNLTSPFFRPGDCPQFTNEIEFGGSIRINLNPPLE